MPEKHRPPLLIPALTLCIGILGTYTTQQVISAKAQATDTVNISVLQQDMRELKARTADYPPAHELVTQAEFRAVVGDIHNRLVRIEDKLDKAR